MSDEEKAKKYDEIVRLLWEWAVDGNTLQSTLGASLIRQLRIEGPNGEDPDSA